MKISRCRGCGASTFEVVLDLGQSPISNSLLASPNEFLNEASFELCVLVCLECGFCQLSEELSRELHFNEDYVYFSSFSTFWLEHCKRHATSMHSKLHLKSDDLVIEIASNDGYMLNIFKNLGVQVLGIEPSANVAEKAQSLGIPTLVNFFGKDVAQKLAFEGVRPKLIVANNVLAHVPDINDFISGLGILLTEDSLATIEFPHLTELLKENQFDTIYHEHYSYLSVTALLPIFRRNHLEIIDVEKIESHGGSLRLHIVKTGENVQPNLSVQEILQEESLYDPRNIDVRRKFQDNVKNILSDFSKIVREAKSKGKIIVGYGAAAKGNTLLNASEINFEVMDYIVDENPAKQGKFSPGTHIPIHAPSKIQSDNVDMIIILPWNLTHEISKIIRSKFDSRIEILRAVPKVEYL
jgi:C-methyltransferase C-terminal domain/Methyltransferase domain/Putative zinc binding domain